MPTLLDEPPVHALAYPVEMVIAEKLVTALERGGTNTRWRDFVDLLALAQREVDRERASRAVHRVAAHRGVEVEGFARLREDFGPEAELKWEAWRRKVGLEQQVPDTFEDVVAALATWAQQLLDGRETQDSADHGADTGEP